MKQYSFLNEANWAKIGANTIGSIGQHAIRRGAAAGALTGAAVGAYNNRKNGGSLVGGALKGATVGTAIGAGGGLAVKKLAQSGLAREVQGDLINKAKKVNPKLIASTTRQGNTALHATNKAAEQWRKSGSLTGGVTNAANWTKGIIAGGPRG